jgi:hypothetical protein
MRLTQSVICKQLLSQIDKHQEEIGERKFERNTKAFKSIEDTLFPKDLRNSAMQDRYKAPRRFYDSYYSRETPSPKR